MLHVALAYTKLVLMVRLEKRFRLFKQLGQSSFIKITLFRSFFFIDFIEFESCDIWVIKNLTWSVDPSQAFWPNSWLESDSKECCYTWPLATPSNKYRTTKLALWYKLDATISINSWTIWKFQPRVLAWASLTKQFPQLKQSRN
jgi:hypothetical protein